jgi:predicted P-loop ATPase
MDPIIQVKNFVHKAYKIRKNEMTGSLEVNGETLDDELLNTIYILCRSVIDKINGRDIIYHVLDSRFTPRYHLVKDMMAKYDQEPPEQLRGHIKALVDTLETDTVYAHAFIKKWLVALIASAYGQHSVLELILQGPQNCGKTEWFRRLLPPILQQYYAESKMDEGKDDLILMSKKLIIMDDELSGKSKQEERKMKSISSKQTLDLRVPFGRTSSTLNRIAMFAGTANDDEIVDDPTGNRRRIVIGIKSVNFEAYNAIDKELLLYECYLEYIEGFNYQMTAEDIALLESGGQQFKRSVPEEELLAKHFVLPADKPEIEVTEMSSSEVFDYLKQRTRLNINSNTLGKYLKKLGFEQKHRKTGKTTIRKYQLVRMIDVDDNKLDELV